MKGQKEQTPIAIIQEGTTSRQRIVVSGARWNERNWQVGYISNCNHDNLGLN